MQKKNTTFAYRLPNILKDKDPYSLYGVNVFFMLTRVDKDCAARRVPLMYIPRPQSYGIFGLF